MNKQSGNSQRLWYNIPAREWEEALPIGNGRLGAMINGGISEEVIYLNEDSLWYGGPKERINNDGNRYVDKIRDLLFKGELDEAQYLAKMALSSNPKYLNPYQPLGDLKFTFRNRSENVEGYERRLNLDEAITNVSFDMDGIEYSREIFSSFEDDVLVMKFDASKKRKLSFCVNINRRPFEGESIKLSENSVAMLGECGADGVRFASVIKVLNKGGAVKCIGEYLSVDKADEVIILFAANSTYRTPDPLREGVEQIYSTEKKEYDEIKNNHISKYKALYSRMSLELDDIDRSHELRPTDERIRKYDGSDHGLTEMYFNFGRYLMISSSYPGTIATNLQGIWNHEWNPAWESKYTININTQMNYWPAEVCNLSECHEPLFDLIKKMVVHGKKVAKEVYGCRGFVAHHNTNIWGQAASEGVMSNSPFWPMGGAWLSLHLWEHFAFTQDKEFLKDVAYPILKEAALFLLDFQVESPSGELVTGPSLSPENNYRLPDGTTGYLCMGPSMDTQITRELFDSCIKSAGILGCDDELVQKMIEAKDKMPRNKIGKYGQIMEWAEDYDEVEPGHRHVSQLFALHPGSQIGKTSTPELFEAAKETLERRLKFGGGHTGWSRAWIINLYARIQKPEEALDNLSALLSESTYPNMFDGCPPFQIDGNFGGTAAIAEMLLQSHEDVILTLPALPSAWNSGAIYGIKARGGYEIDMKWKGGKIIYLKLKSISSGICRIVVNGELIETKMEKGDIYIYQ